MNANGAASAPVGIAAAAQRGRGSFHAAPMRQRLRGEDVESG